MKNLLSLIALIAITTVYAQVGVNTENPETTLHMVGANATDTGATGNNTPGALAATDGITIPVVTTDMTGTPASGTKTGQMVYSNNGSSTGFYYWNGSAWTALGGNSGSTTDWTPGTHANIDMTADLDNLSALTNYSDSVNSYTITTGTNGWTLNLPTPASHGGRILSIKNASGVILNFQADQATIVNNNRSAIFFCDGNRWFGYGN